MLSMASTPCLAPILSRRDRRVGAAGAAGLLALLVAAATPAIARADTDTAYPQGYTDNVADPPEAAATAGDPADEYADTDPSALTDFRQPLDAHGAWVQDATYGTLWVPNSAEVGADFAPYQTAGRWSLADSGDWMWQSDYAWGHIPFHYGRWVWANSYWGWIPGRTYSPAWVTWRVGEGGYLGWAPLPPTWYWGNGYAVGLWSVPYAAYCFVPTNYAFYNNVSTYVVRDRGLVGAAAASTRPYHPATPHAGGHGAPIGGHAPQHAGYRMSPSLGEAHIPASAAPRASAPADARAVSYATRSSTTAVHDSQAATQGRSLGNVAPRPGGNAWNNSYNGSRNAPNARNASDARSAPHGSAPAFHGDAQAGRAAPSFHPAPSFRSTPSFEVTHPSGYAAPSYHSAGPGYHSGGPSFHAAPVSRPSQSSSAPARSSGRGGGGFRGGGGGGHRR